MKFKLARMLSSCLFAFMVWKALYWMWSPAKMEPVKFPAWVGEGLLEPHSGQRNHQQLWDALGLKVTESCHFSLEVGTLMCCPGPSGGLHSPAHCGERQLDPSLFVFRREVGGGDALGLQRELEEESKNWI